MTQQKGKAKKKLSKTLIAVIFTVLLIASMHSTGASAADVPITKTTGTTINPTYNTGDTLIITGSALETTDWDKLRGLTAPFKLDLRNNQTFIPNNALLGPTALTDLDLSSLVNLTSIGEGTFRYCSALKTVDLSGLTQLTNIGGNAFRDCTNLTSVTINTDTPPALGNAAFMSANAVTIYAPANRVSNYQSDWAPYFSKIVAISTTLVDTPTATPVSGSYTGAQTATLACSTTGATMFYTLDGSNPVTSSTRKTYSAPFSVPMGTTLKAYAKKPGMTPSTIMTATYTQATNVAEPIASPPGGSYNSEQTVTLTCATSGATIYYTLDGSDPVANTARKTYSTPFTVAMGTTLKAYAAKAGVTDSAVLTQTYTQATNTVGTPKATPPGGFYSSEQTVTLTSATLDATIYYTLDGSDPVANTARKTYIEPFTVSIDTTLKMCATKVGMTDSAVLAQIYTSKNNGDSSGGSCNSGLGFLGLCGLLVPVVVLAKKKV